MAVSAARVAVRSAGGCRLVIKLADRRRLYQLVPCEDRGAYRFWSFFAFNGDRGRMRCTRRRPGAAKRRYDCASVRLQSLFETARFFRTERDL